MVTIAKVHENLFSGEAESLSVTTSEGQITVLPKHEPLVANLKAGSVTVKTAGGTEVYDIAGGVLEVSNNQVTVLL